MQKMKVGTRWYVSMWKSWTMKISIASPSAWCPSKKRSATPPGKQSYWCFFSMSWLAQCPGICKNRFFDFDCRNLGKRLARTLHNPSNRLKGESGAGTLLAETRQNPAQPGGTELAKAWNPAEPSGTRRSGRTQRNPAEPGGTRRNPATTPPFNLLFFRRIPPGFRQVSAGFRQVPPGSAGFRQVSQGFGRFLAGFHQPRASARLAQSRQVCVKFLFPSFCQAPAVLFPKQFSAELSAQHCLPEGRRLLEQLCSEIKVHATNLSSPMRGAGRWRPLTVSLAGAKSDNENPVCTWCLEVVPGAFQLGSK